MSTPQVASASPPSAASLQLHISLPNDNGSRTSVSGVQVVFTRTDSSNFTRVETTTDSNGNATLVVVPGRYQLSTPALVHSQGKWYGWDLELALTQAQNRVELNERNASFDAESSASEPVPVPDQGSVEESDAAPPSTSAGTAGTATAAAPARGSSPSPPANSRPAVAANAGPAAAPAPAAAAEVRTPEPAPRQARGLGAYTIVVVGNFTVSDDPEKVRDLPPDVSKRLTQIIIRKLRDRDWFPIVLDTEQGAATLQPASTPRTQLTISGEITDYKKAANVVTRTLAVGFAGVPKIGVTFILRDAATGQELFRLRHVEENVDFLANQLLKDISHRR